MPILISLPNPEDYKKIKCKQCFATIGYLPKEVQTRSYTVMGDSSIDSYIVCPNCQEDIILKTT